MCFPTRSLTGTKVLIAISVGLVIIPVVACSATVIHMKWIEIADWLNISFGLSNYHYLYSGPFEKRCDQLYVRSTVRVIGEALICLGLPAVISGYFYIHLALKLLQRGKDNARNRNITLALSFSWLLWVICWVPYYWGIYIEETPTLKAGFDLWNAGVRKVEFSTKKYFEILFSSLKNSVQLTYSHLNALLLLIVLKPFRSWVYETARSILLSKPKQEQASSKRYDYCKISVETSTKVKNNLFILQVTKDLYLPYKEKKTILSKIGTPPNTQRGSKIFKNVRGWLHTKF